MHGLVQAEKADKWEVIGGKDFDKYDGWAFNYGFIESLQEGFPDNGSASECFYAAFSFNQTFDYWVIDCEDFLAKRNIYNVVFYGPLKMLNNYAAAYEYCNAYAFLTQFS